MVMESSVVLKIGFSSSTKANAFCEIVNAFKDELWERTKNEIGYSKLKDTSKLQVSARDIFESYIDSIQKALGNKGVVIDDCYLFLNCTPSTNGDVLTLVIESDTNALRISEELIFMLLSSGGKLLEKTYYGAKS